MAGLGEIGRPESFEITLTAEPDTDLWLGPGAQALDLAAFLFREIDRVEGQFTGNGFDLMLGMPDNVRGRVRLGEEAEHYLEIRGTRGKIALGRESSYLHRTGTQPMSIGEVYDEASTYLRMIAEFARVRWEGAQPWCSLSELRHVHQVLAIAEARLLTETTGLTPVWSRWEAA